MRSEKQAVRRFWDASPCGSRTADDPGSVTFFQGVEERRRHLEPHILEIASALRCADSLMLEVGCGLGTDGAHFAKAGARYVGMDLSERSVGLARKNFEWRRLGGSFLNTDGERLPFPDACFDLIWSHGVLHHTPDTQGAINEVYRVLKPGGRAVVMLYHRRSVNYYLGILGLRRLGALLLFGRKGIDRVARLTGESKDRLSLHRDLLRARGLSYLRSDEWLSYNTDGAGNPHSKVFAVSEAHDLFREFGSVQMAIRHLNHQWMPGLRHAISRRFSERLGKRFGWHLYVLATK